jgi:hypothetical protein
MVLSSRPTARTTGAGSIGARVLVGIWQKWLLPLIGVTQVI